MARVKRGVTSHAKHKKVLEQAKGFCGRRKNTIRAPGAWTRPASTPTATARSASASSARCGSSASTPPAREEGMTYRPIYHGLKLAGIELDRKVLADIAGPRRRPRSRPSPTRFAPRWPKA